MEAVSITLNIPGWAVIVIALMFVVTVSLSLYRTLLEVKLHRLRRHLGD